VKLLLDTHVLIWWLSDEEKLTASQVAALAASSEAGEPLGLASISLWEVAKLVELGRITLPVTVDDFLEGIEAHPGVRVLPLGARVALESTRLGPRFHRDPADQIIAATARTHGLLLVTADRRIRDAHVVSVV